LKELSTSLLLAKAAKSDVPLGELLLEAELLADLIEDERLHLKVMILSNHTSRFQPIFGNQPYLDYIQCVLTLVTIRLCKLSLGAELGIVPPLTSEKVEAVIDAYLAWWEDLGKVNPHLSQEQCDYRVMHLVQWLTV
jgi:hypothetical protein